MFEFFLKPKYFGRKKSRDKVRGGRVEKEEVMVKNIWFE